MPSRRTSPSMHAPDDDSPPRFDAELDEDLADSLEDDDVDDVDDIDDEDAIDEDANDEDAIDEDDDDEEGDDDLPDDEDGEDLDDEFPLGDGAADSAALASCPYCGEPVEVLLDAGGGDAQEYVEDCEVCCRPWRVRVRYRRDGTADVRLQGLDE